MSEMRACAFAFEVAICDLNCEEIAGFSGPGSGNWARKADSRELTAESWLRLTSGASFHYNQRLPAGLPWH